MDHFAPARPPGTPCARASASAPSADDIDRLLGAVAQIARDGAAWTYVESDGSVLPDPDPRPRPSLGGLLSGPLAVGESACRG